MTMINTTTKYKASRNFIYRKIAGSDVLVSVGANVADFNGYIQLNPVAVDIWKALQGTSSVSSLVEMVVSKYDTTNETAEQDVLEFMNELAEHKMIEEVEG